MPKRNKSRLEKWFSFSRHKRRNGAKELSNKIKEDFSRQKNNILADEKVVYTHGSDNDIKQHFLALKKEFSGQSELCYTHAKIIVLIRREYKVKDHYQLFEKLWREEKSYLIKSLNTRWLVAACDTFVDHSADINVAAAALTCSCLINTIKLQETERFITETIDAKDKPSKIDYLQQANRYALFDGTSALAVGTDDTLRNMRWRIDKMAKQSISGEILLELFKRLNQHDTVYSRFKQRHNRKRTAWW